MNPEIDAEVVSILHKKWRVGYSDGSGNGDGGYCITTYDNECVIFSGTSFGDPVGVQDRELAHHIVDTHNAHLAAVLAAAKGGA